MATNVSNWRKEIAGDVRGCFYPIIDMYVIEACRDICKETNLWREKLSAIDVISVEATDIAFVHGDPCTITSTSTDFTDVDGDGTNLTFVAGQKIVIHNSSDNDREVVVETVEANTLTLYSGQHLEDESAGSSVVLSGADYGLASLVTSIGDIACVIEAVYDDYDPMTPASMEELDKWESSWKDRIVTIPDRYIVDHDFKIRLVYSPYEALQGGLIVTVSMMPLRTATTVEDFLYKRFMEAVKFGAMEKLFRLSTASWYNIEKAEFYKKEFRKEMREAAARGRHGFNKSQGGISA